MPQYFSFITDRTKISTARGSSLVVEGNFLALSAQIISDCIFIQNQIQNVIFASHGQSVNEAKRILQEQQHPRNRMDFLLGFQFEKADHITEAVFKYARKLFGELYELRNVLAHEIWLSSSEFEGSVLFADLKEEARLNLARGRLIHSGDINSQGVHDAIVRYIQKLKVVRYDQLQLAKKHSELCSWMLLNIHNSLSADDNLQAEEIKRSFLVYGGTSHLFDESLNGAEPVDMVTKHQKSIKY